MVREPNWVAVTNHSGTPAGNEVLWCADGEAEDALTRARAFFPGRFKWALADGIGPTDMAQVLIAAGFETWDVAAMRAPTGAGGLNLGPGADEKTPLRTQKGEAIEIQRVSLESPAFEAFVECFRSGWGYPDADRNIWSALFREGGPQRWQHFVAVRESDGILIGSASTVTPRDVDFGYLFGAQVFAGFRRCGVYRALAAARLHDLGETGRTEALTLARAATSSPLLKRWGFETAFEYRMAQAPERFADS